MLKRSHGCLPFFLQGMGIMGKFIIQGIRRGNDLGISVGMIYYFPQFLPQCLNLLNHIVKLIHVYPPVDILVGI